MDVKPKIIELNIEELVLHGFQAGERYHIGEAVERELTRLLAEQGMPHSLVKGGDIELLDGGEFKVAQGAKSEVVGTQVAKAIFGGLGK